MRSVGSPALEYRRDCAEKDVPVEPQEPVVDVELVELLLQFDIFTASYGYLPETRQSRRYRAALVAKFTIHRKEVVLRKGSRSHDGHLPCNDVHQLREL